MTTKANPELRLSTTDPSMESMLKQGLQTLGLTCGLASTQVHAVSDAGFDVALSAEWETGKVMQKYTLLLDDAPAQHNSNNRNQWRVEGGESLADIAVHLRPSNTVSIDQMMVALFDKNPAAFVDGDIQRLHTGAILQIPSATELDRLDKADAARRMSSYRTTQTGASASLAHQGDTMNTPSNTKTPGRSVDLERRLENALARLGDASEVINEHLLEIEDLNLLVEDLKHVIELKNSELAQLQARALGSITTANETATATIESTQAQAKVKTESLEEASAANDDADQEAEPTSRSFWAAIGAVFVAFFGVLTFSRLRNKSAKSEGFEPLIDEMEQHEQAESSRLPSLDDEELQRGLEAKHGDVVAEAEMLSAYGKYDEAIERLQQALNEQPECEAYVDALREIYMLTGRFDELAALPEIGESANDDDYHVDSGEQEVFRQRFDDAVAEVITAAQDVNVEDAVFESEVKDPDVLDPSLLNIDEAAETMDEDLEQTAEPVWQPPVDQAMDLSIEVEATPLELVQAYIELDDRDAARRMLQDIIGDGDANEKARAKAMLAEIS